MKRLMLATALLGLAFGVSAQQAEPEEDVRLTRAERAAANERYCIRETGSRITASREARSRSERDACINAGGRVYTREDIERSGGVDVKDALRRLDPSIR
ncbi:MULTISPECIES: hypothetical protein [unclassified Luteimonas]|uniref:hypothetical protein n=1 Tax=Lysobacteraceae TaxID=32033 RepID=UPI00100C1C39|nr:MULTISPECIES: hypothetical protein [unclassified Luteimonas]MCD9045853.1 hypothetical protein [Luteimonas sp. MHLX1A]